MPEHSQTKDIHQRITLVSGIEDKLPPNRGNPHAVAVMRDAGDHAMDEGTGSFARLAWGIRPSKPQRIHKCHRPGSHGENIPQDPPHPGGRTLERLHGAGMVMGFDFKSQREAVSGIHHAGVFLAGFHQNCGSGRGKLSQLPAGVFVGAVLAPHHRKHAELGLIGLPAQSLLDPIKLLRG